MDRKICSQCFYSVCIDTICEYRNICNFNDCIHTLLGSYSSVLNSSYTLNMFFFHRFSSIFLLTWVMMSLTSCGSNNDNTALSQDTGAATKTFTPLEIQVPSSWSWVELNMDPPPRQWELIGTFVSDKSYAGFKENFTILKETYHTNGSGQALPTQASYLARSIESAKPSYLSHMLIADKKTVFADDSEWITSIFDAQYNDQWPKRRFVQTAKICGENIYLLTYALSLNGNTDEAFTLLKTAKCIK